MKTKKHNSVTENSINFYNEKIERLEKELAETKVKLIKEKLFDIISFNVEPYFDTAENEIRVSNLSVTVDKIYDYLKDIKLIIAKSKGNTHEAEHTADNGK
jgi:hypothetical protein